MYTNLQVRGAFRTQRVPGDVYVTETHIFYDSHYFLFTEVDSKCELLKCALPCDEYMTLQEYNWIDIED